MQRINETDSGFIGFTIKEIGYMPGKCTTITEGEREQLIQDLWARYTGSPVVKRTTKDFLLKTIYN